MNELPLSCNLGHTNRSWPEKLCWPGDKFVVKASVFNSLFVFLSEMLEADDMTLFNNQLHMNCHSSTKKLCQKLHVKNQVISCKTFHQTYSQKFPIFTFHEIRFVAKLNEVAAFPDTCVTLHTFLITQSFVGRACRNFNFKVNFSILSFQTHICFCQAVQVDTQKMEEVAISWWKNLSVGTQPETTVLTVLDTWQGSLMKLNRTGLSPSLGKFQITRSSRSQSCSLPAHKMWC